MATGPSPEDSARYILSIYIAHNCRPTHALMPQHFGVPFSAPGWHADDWKPGLEYAVQQGWIEIVSPTSFRLTEAGFAAA